MMLADSQTDKTKVGVKRNRFCSWGVLEKFINIGGNGVDLEDGTNKCAVAKKEEEKLRENTYHPSGTDDASVSAPARES